MNSIFSEIITRERSALKGFFSSDMDVPPLPTEVTEKRYRHWKEHGFDLHYLPSIAITPSTKVSSWKQHIAWNPGFVEELFGSNRPGMNLFKEREDLHVYSDALTLPGQWVLVDTRDRPKWKDGNQSFSEDTLIGTLLETLRKTERLPAHSCIQTSRFELSWDELHSPELSQGLAYALEVDIAMLRLPHAIEWNMLANLWYPSWGDSDTDEWFEDEYRGGLRVGRVQKLYGGNSRNGGVAYISCAVSSQRDARRSFRPLVAFPKNRES